MEQCLIDNKVCSEQNRKCKNCKLDDCRRTIQMIEDEQKWIDKDNLERLRKKLPEECQGCSFLEIVNLSKQKVHCAYRINNKCLIGRKSNGFT